MTELSRIYGEADRLQAATSWLLEQWLSDVDAEWRFHVLDGLRSDDPDIFATLDALNAEDAGEPLLPGDGSAPGSATGSQPGDDRTTPHGAVIPVAGEPSWGGDAA